MKDKQMNEQKNTENNSRANDSCKPGETMDDG
jgi:hypothetical protein